MLVRAGQEKTGRKATGCEAVDAPPANRWAIAGPATILRLLYTGHTGNCEADGAMRAASTEATAIATSTSRRIFCASRTPSDFTEMQIASGVTQRRLSAHVSYLRIFARSNAADASAWHVDGLERRLPRSRTEIRSAS